MSSFRLCGDVRSGTVLFRIYIQSKCPSSRICSKGIGGSFLLPANKFVELIGIEYPYKVLFQMLQRLIVCTSFAKLSCLFNRKFNIELQFLVDVKK